MLSEELRAPIASLLAQMGHKGDFCATALHGGNNNRAFRIEIEHSAYFLKAYFRHPDDPRDRLGTEFIFLEFAWNNGLRQIPQPIAQDTQAGVGLYQYVEGRKLSAEEVSTAHVQQALDFYTALNAHKNNAQKLPIGSEACFSLAEHLQTVERRVKRLISIQAKTSTDAAALQFVQSTLLPAWEQCQRRVHEHASELDLPLTSAIPFSDRCVSPSDFGFHNALLTADNRLVFIDFEYAGWDDRAKLICDFFCQPAIPIPSTHFAWMAQTVAERLSDKAAYLERFRLLLPVYYIKWSCILLNHFLPTGYTRRQYAAQDAPSEAQKAQQLEKARAMLAREVL